MKTAYTKWNEKQGASWWLRLCTSTAGHVGSIPDWESSACNEVQLKKRKKLKGKIKLCLYNKKYKQTHISKYSNEISKVCYVFRLVVLGTVFCSVILLLHIK